MTMQEIKFEYDIPEGYRFVRYGCPKRGESYLSKNDVRIAGYDYNNEWPIVERWYIAKSLQKPQNNINTLI
jgi:hypothetical protein